MNEQITPDLPPGPYDVAQHPFSGRWEIWTEHAGVIAECDNESDARGIAAHLAASWSLAARLAAAEAALAFYADARCHIRFETEGNSPVDDDAGDIARAYFAQQGRGKEATP